MKTNSTDEAMSVLNAYRSNLISTGKIVAKEIASVNGIVHSRDVITELSRRGMLTDPTIGDYWIGAVFNKNENFEWSGKYHTYSDESRNIHERTVKIWVLKSLV